jgi:hypothetical protein
LQPDTLIPDQYNPQSWNRYSYVQNNPIALNDPTGHFTCSNDPTSDDYCPRHSTSGGGGGGGGPSGNPEDQPGCGVNGTGSYGFHCTEDDLDSASLDQRLKWFKWLTQNMNANFRGEASDWFNNIKTVVAGLAVTGQDDNGWALTVDANILVAVQDGYAASLGFHPGASSDSGAGQWKIFFNALRNREDEDQLIKYWGLAEQAGTNEGLSRAAELGYGGRVHLDWLWTAKGLDGVLFLRIGNLYRGAGSSKCATQSCVGGFYDPRKISPYGFSFSPVGYAEIPTYFFDGVGALITGH